MLLYIICLGLPKKHEVSLVGGETHTHTNANTDLLEADLWRYLNSRREKRLVVAKLLSKSLYIHT